MRFPSRADFARLRVNLPTIRGRQMTWPIVRAVVAGMAGLGLGTAWALSAHMGSNVASPVTTPSPAASSTASPTAVAPSPIVTPSVQPGDIIAATTVETLSVYAAPGDPTPARTLGKWSYYGQPLTLLALDVTGIGDVEWLKVLLPLEPNGTTGWIRAIDVTTSSTDLSLHVFLDEKIVELRRGDEVLVSTPAVIGADATPTPTGLFYITDPLEFANPNGVYGAYAIGLSGYSDTLTSFAGGPPQVAIHGTNEPQLLGTAASHGCVRVANDAIVEIAGLVGLGTPVFIQESQGRRRRLTFARSGPRASNLSTSVSRSVSSGSSPARGHGRVHAAEETHSPMVPEAAPRVLTLTRRSYSPVRGNPEVPSPVGVTGMSLVRRRRFARTRAVAEGRRP